MVMRAGFMGRPTGWGSAMILSLLSCVDLGRACTSLGQFPLQVEISRPVCFLVLLVGKKQMVNMI